MSTSKSVRSANGKAIRKATGLSFPLAMTIAKKVCHDKGGIPDVSKIIEYLDVRFYPPLRAGEDPEYRLLIIGPKGTYDYGWSPAIYSVLRDRNNS